MSKMKSIARASLEKLRVMSRVTARWSAGFLLVGGVAVAAAQPAAPAAAAPSVADAKKKTVEVVLTQAKVVKGANGAEQLLDATAVKPGDIIEYRATYTNNTGKAVSGLVANLPLPEGLEYQAKSAKPGAELVKAATKDGVFAAEPLMRTRRILFTHAIASADANLNPQSIRVTYEVDSGGPKFTVAGTDVQVKVTDRLQLGVVASTDENPANKRKLGALTAVSRLGDNTTMAAELVKTESDLKGKGSGGRIELRHQDENLAVVALGSKTSVGFDNPGASFAAGHTEASGRVEYKIDPTLAVRGEALYSKDAALLSTTGSSDSEGVERKGVTVSVQKKLSDTVVAEVGMRHGQSNAALASSSGFDYGQVSTYNGQLGGSVGANNVTALGAAATAATADTNTQTTVRARLSAQVPNVPQAQVFIEGEQDVKDSSRHVLAVGGNYAITDKTRVYGRYELISTLHGP